jgi:sugar phosphate permease
VFDRTVGHRREVLAIAHILSALLLALMAAGAPHYPVSNLFGVTVMPAQYDLVLFVLIGFAVSAQPLVYGMTQQQVDPRNAGKALSAINLAFFLGAALMQSATGIVAAAYGLPAVLIFMALALIVGTILFLAYT